MVVNKSPRHRYANGAPSRATPSLKKLGRALLMYPEKYRWCRELCELSGLESGSVSPMLKKLESIGWIESTPYYRDPKRKNMKFYLLTKEGEEMLGALVWSDD